ncbi:MAG: hypothetical protein NZ921_03850, partial [Candidatus Caldarchaeum sp.]|nr:hypothetical protein [Candidatus Caldarchaeum sp.]
MSQVGEGDLGLYRVLSPEGELVGEPDPSITDDLLRKMMREMVMLRTFYTWMMKIHPLVKASRYAPVVGLAGAVVGRLNSLSRNEWVFPTYRELTIVLILGDSITKLLHRMFATGLDPMKGHEITI